jgi:hypothetical protein
MDSGQGVSLRVGMSGHAHQLLKRDQAADFFS